MITNHDEQPEQDLWETVNHQLFMQEIKEHEETQEKLRQAKLEFADRILEISWGSEVQEVELLGREAKVFKRLIEEVLKWNS